MRIQFSGLVAILFLGIAVFSCRNAGNNTREEGFLKETPQSIDFSRLPEKEIELVLTDSVVTNLSEFPSDLDTSMYTDLREFYFFDLDTDHIPELFVKYYTGGAHCCDQYHIFRYKTGKSFAEIFKYMGGSGSLSAEPGRIVIDFSEQVGYFFTCYACSIRDSLPNQNFYPRISIAYNLGRFMIAPPADSVNELVLKNLTYLRNREIPPRNGMDMDDGTRKAFAELVITWHYNNGADFGSTKAFFDHYYHSPDSVEVWNALVDHAENMLDMGFSIEEYVDKVMEVSRTLKKDLDQP